MASASAIRLQIESSLAHRVPSALTPKQKIIRPVAPTGITALDPELEGGLPVGAITELVGPECSGATSIALSFLAQTTRSGKICAWIDVSDALDPASAAAAGVDLARMLWVRCGAVEKPSEQRLSRVTRYEKFLIPCEAKKGLHGGSFGPHPRTEARGLSEAVGDLFSPRCSEPQPRLRIVQEPWEPGPRPDPVRKEKPVHPRKPWARIEQALRATDLLLQAGGFSAIVLDMASLAPEFVARVPLATWFRYRAAAEKTQSCLLLLTQHSCAKSSAELLLRLETADPIREETTVFSGIRPTIEIARRRFTQEPVQPLRKRPQSVRTATWMSRTVWAGQR